MTFLTRASCGASVCFAACIATCLPVRAQGSPPGNTWNVSSGLQVTW